jgi:universal stress protein A
VASVITGEAADRGADLIVMGTHGRGGFAHALLGSVAERIVRTAPCSVLTVRDTSLGGGRHATITSHLARHLEC